MNPEQIEQDMETFVTKRHASPMQVWFDEQPDLYAAVIRKVVYGDFPALTMYYYLVDRYNFPFGESTFRHTVNRQRVLARKEQAA